MNVNTLHAALYAADSNTRLRAVLAAGTDPDADFTDVLLDALGTEPDFYVRDMLTWALTRQPIDATVPQLIDIVQSSDSTPQARAQALHTLSKIADPRGWSVVTDALLADPDDDVARTAWRTAALLAPDAERAKLARRLTGQLGRGDQEVRRSLSRVFVDLGDIAVPVLTAIAETQVSETQVSDTQATETRVVETHVDETAVADSPVAKSPVAESRATANATVAAHARATLRLIADPDAAFTLDVDFAKRVDALGDLPVGSSGHGVAG